MSIVFVALAVLTTGVPPLLGALAAVVLRGKGHAEAARFAAGGVLAHVGGSVLCGGVLSLMAVGVGGRALLLGGLALGALAQVAANLWWLRTARHPIRWATVYGGVGAASLAPVLWLVWRWGHLDGLGVGLVVLAILPLAALFVAWVQGAGAFVAMGAALVAPRPETESP